MAYTTPRSCPGHFAPFRTRITGVTTQAAILVLSVALLASCPAKVLGAPPDPVLQWIGFMNSAVIAGGTSP